MGIGSFLGGKAGEAGKFVVDAANDAGKFAGGLMAGFFRNINGGEKTMMDDVVGGASGLADTISGATGGGLVSAGSKAGEAFEHGYLTPTQTPSLGAASQTMIS